MSDQLNNPSAEIIVEELSYEQAMAQLEAIVAALESGERPLDHVLELYERGQALAQHCSTLLDQAESKVKKLSGEDLVDFELEE